MPRAIPIHPVLIATFPILSLYSANLGIFSVSDLWVPLATVIGLVGAAWVLMGLALRDAARGAVGASVLAVCVTAYSVFGHVSSGMLFMFLWLLVSVAASVFVALKWKGTAPLNVLGCFLILASTGSIAFRTFKATFSTRAGRLPILGSMATADSPDVYYIILDGYGRHDALQQFIDYSNSDFLDALRKRGFLVADKSHSNYVQTEISIPSSLNMNFIPTLLPDIDPNEGQRVSLDHLARDNEAERQFTARGYKTTLVTSGFPIFDHVASNYMYTAKKNQTLMEATLTMSSPLANAGSDNAMYQERREQLLGAFEALKRMAGRRAKPRFIFAHILAPHPPFVFDAEGRPVRPPYPFGLWDGSDFEAAGMKSDEYRKGYAEFVQNVNRWVLSAIDTILSKKGVRPIIILQGDHGSKRFLNQNDLSKTDVRECFANLFAILAPPSVMKGIYPSITPVNELRVVLNGLFNAQLPMLPDRSWYSAYDKPYRFIDVTDAVDRYAGIPPPKP